MTPENYDPHTNESGDSYQSSHPYGVPEGQRPGPYQHYQQQPPVQPPRRTGSQALAAASMVMAICSFLFMLNMGSLFFGSLGVIFALLSRGAGRMSGTAKAGLAGCTIGIIVGICMYAFLLFNMVSGGSTNVTLTTGTIRSGIAAAEQAAEQRFFHFFEVFKYSRYRS